MALAKREITPSRTPAQTTQPLPALNPGVELFEEEPGIPFNITPIEEAADAPPMADEFPDPEPMELEPPQGKYATRPWLKKYSFGPGRPPPRSPGRPRKMPNLPTILNDVGKEQVPAWFRVQMRQNYKIWIPTKQTNWECMARAIWRKANKGDMAAIQFLAERIEGKVAQVMDITARRGEDERPEEMTDEQLLSIASGEAITNGGDDASTPFDSGNGTAEAEAFQE